MVFSVHARYKFLKDQPKWIEWRIQKAAAKNQKINANSTATAAPTGYPSSICEEREVVLPNEPMPSRRPAVRKKEKENQRKGSDQSRIDALDHLWAKKKEADAEKERVKAEMYKVAFALDQQRIDLDKEKFEFKSISKLHSHLINNGLIWIKKSLSSKE
uniref:No apical meristem-associated C-terminal domain-containing protein n=1 Tax=Oryza punctata TaxID=4537 RepID=A0A0E0JN64_ORYPU